MKTTPLHTWIASRTTRAEETFTRASLDAWQFQRLQTVISYVRERARFYRDLFTCAPDTLHSFDDLAAFPFTNADDLRADPNRFACVSQDEVSRIVTLPTSGTTGPSKRLFFSQADQELTVDFFKVGMSTLARAGDRVLILLPGARPGSVGDLLKSGLERLGCRPFVYGPVDEEAKVFESIKENDCNVLVGAPVQLHRLARWDQFHHVLKTGQIRALLSSTDVLANTIRDNLQTIWGCEVFDHWGMTETGLGGGVECEAHRGAHLREADIYVEIIDPVSGEVLPKGEMGEVVVTTLTRNAMPLVRYRTGDLSHLIPGECACGSFIRRLERVTGRVNAGVELPSGLLTQNMLDEALFQIEEVLDFSADYQPPKLSLSVRIIVDHSLAVEEKIQNALRHIPVVEQASASQALKIELRFVDNFVPEKTALLYKRQIENKSKQ